MRFIIQMFRIHYLHSKTLLYYAHNFSPYISCDLLRSYDILKTYKVTYTDKSPSMNTRYCASAAHIDS